MLLRPRAGELGALMITTLGRAGRLRPAEHIAGADRRVCALPGGVPGGGAAAGGAGCWPRCWSPSRRAGCRRPPPWSVGHSQPDPRPCRRFWTLYGPRYAARDCCRARRSATVCAAARRCSSACKASLIPSAKPARAPFLSCSRVDSPGATADPPRLPTTEAPDRRGSRLVTVSAKYPSAVTRLNITICRRSPLKPTAVADARQRIPATAIASHRDTR